MSSYTRHSHFDAFAPSLSFDQRIFVTDCNRNRLQDCNQRIFGTGLSALSNLPKTELSASETAINRLGLQSTVLGPHYSQLYALTVLGPSFLALTRLRIWGAPWRCSCLVRL